ncbi:MAG: RagB/SusD family nutrient uptake outer membrane protein [Alistipes sp.]|nr:RagB/SusD family nutrient uptake outer membrane protein [Alistipes sp.]
MKKIFFAALAVSTIGLASCHDWLTEEAPGTTKYKDFFTSGETAVQVTTAAYVPLLWEYNKTYYPEWFIGDVMSDDALKGGQNLTDMSTVYFLENFKTVPDNDLLLDFYRAQYQGITRANLVLQNVPDVAGDELLTDRLRSRLLGEAHFLRAYYYFRLVRCFGGVPRIETVIDDAGRWKQPRATAESIYELILSDLAFAEKNLWHKSEYERTDLGRATIGAAQAMLMKVNLYRHDYAEARRWGAELMKTADELGEYSLCPVYADNFTVEGENGPESIFELQYAAVSWGDYGDSYIGGNCATAGTFSTVLMRSRSSKLGGGWGFNKPTQNLYDEFEEGDLRRDVAIYNPADENMSSPSEEIYLGSRYINGKYTLMGEDGLPLPLADSHASRGELNNRQIRFADALLMYAEACLESGEDLDKGAEALNRVRRRVNLGDVALTRENLRHERRVELAMEGHRWFDLVRWGIAKQTMDAYKACESDEARAEMGEFVAGKHELLPIPAEEVRLGGLEQNPMY